MRIAIASDQAGHEAKQRLAEKLVAAGYEVTDAAPKVNSHERNDYAEQVGLLVLRQDVERGIIVTSRTVGASLAANRVTGIRAAVCNDPQSAYDGANADGMNVLVLAPLLLGDERTQEVVDAYLEASLAPVELVGGLLPWHLQRVFAHVRENLAQDLSVAEMARVVAMSQYYFSKLFKTSTGTTPHQYVMRQRVERAQELLQQTPIPLADIATQVGFGTQSHFTSVFRHIVGITPNRYRERYCTLQVGVMVQEQGMPAEREKSANAA